MRSQRTFALVVSLAVLLTVLPWPQVAVQAQTPTIFLPTVRTVKTAWQPSQAVIPGYVQKGPFVQGTVITVRELDMGLVPTGRTFAASIDSNTGHFTVRGLLNFPYVELSATGFYFNEVKGALSTAPLTLRALADVRIATSINVNLLTHLEYDRVLYLVDKGKTFEEAKTIAQQEILRAFNIQPDVINRSEQLDISQVGAGNAALLALSAVVQSNRSEAQLTELLATISGDLRDDGVLDASSAPAALVAGMEYIKPRLATIRSNIAARYVALGAPATIPAFEPYAVALDTAPPTVVGSAPANGTTTFVREIVVTFSELLDLTTVNATTVQFLDASNAPVQGTVSAANTGTATIVTFKCASLLLPGAYRLHIGTGVQDYAGNGVANGTAIAVTHALLTPDVTTDPAAGATTFVVRVNATFNELMDHATLNTTTIRLLNSNNAPVTGAISATDDTGHGKTTATFKPTNRLLAGTYRLLIGSGVRDATGRNFANFGAVQFIHELPVEVIIPAGSFQMGCEASDDPLCNYYVHGESPRHTVTLAAYSIDKYEVTNARYAACVADGGCTAPHDTASNTRADYYVNASYADFPVIYVDWNQATAFCAWDGKRLPTEAEWEKAARGSSDTRIYPWGGATPDCTLGNFRNNATGKDCIGDTTAVGSYPGGASPYGVMDMSGNVYEWVNDWYQDDYYATSPANDPQGPTTSSTRVMRGGAWAVVTGVVRASARGFEFPGMWSHDIGFRCARSQ